MLQLSPDLRLREFFALYYVPHRIEDPTSRNLEGYRRALDLWEQTTPDPPLSEITPATLAEYKAGLYGIVVRGKSLSHRTVRKYLEHALWILKQAGPRGPREIATAAELINWYPAVRLPRAPGQFRPAASVDALRRLYAAADGARLPRLPDLRPGALWRALLSTMAATSLRIGQLCATPTTALRLDRRLLILPTSCCRKSRREEPHPLNSRAVADLAAIRGERDLLFPFFAAHAKKTIYVELRRLCGEAGIEYTTFHAIRRRVITELSAIDPAAAQMAAGHSAYRTTQIYQQLDLLDRAVAGFDLLDARG